MAVGVPFSFDAYATLATTLCSGGAEAEWRAAINRAYYPVYHACSAHAVANGHLPPPRNSKHAAVWRWFDRSTTPPVKAIAVSFHDLMMQRILADYAASASMTAALAAHCAAEAARLLAAIAALP